MFDHKTNFVNQTCSNTLTVRHMMRPFRPGDKLQDHAIPMALILNELQVQLAEFRALKDHIDVVPPAITMAQRTEDNTPKIASPVRRASRSSLDGAELVD